jgi:hypothetical protein
VTAWRSDPGNIANRPGRVWIARPNVGPLRSEGRASTISVGPPTSLRYRIDERFGEMMRFRVASSRSK